MGPAPPVLVLVCVESASGVVVGQRRQGLLAFCGSDPDLLVVAHGLTLRFSGRDPIPDPAMYPAAGIIRNHTHELVMKNRAVASRGTHE